MLKKSKSIPARTFFLGVLLISLTCGPEIFAKFIFGGSFSHKEVLLYPIRPVEQAFNSFRHIVDHIPPQISVKLVEKVAGAIGLAPEIVTRVDKIFHPNEDLAGNAVQFMTALAIMAYLIFRGSRRERTLAICLFFSWVLLHAVVVNQTWMSRLQTPWFVLLSPILGFVIVNRHWRPKWLVALAFLSISGAFYMESWVTLSRLKYSDWHVPATKSEWFKGYYYRRAPAIVDYSALINTLSKCSAVKIYSTGDSYDYPLVWEAVQRGVIVNYEIRSVRPLGECDLDARNG